MWKFLFWKASKVALCRSNTKRSLFASSVKERVQAKGRNLPWNASIVRVRGIWVFRTGLKATNFLVRFVKGGVKC